MGRNLGLRVSLMNIVRIQTFAVLILGSASLSASNKWEPAGYKEAVVTARDKSDFVNKYKEYLVMPNGCKAGNTAVQESRATLFYYSASWCAPCRKVTPVLNERFDDFRSMGLNVVLVGQENTEAMLQYMKKYGIKYPAIPQDKLGVTGVGKFRGKGIPHIAIVSAKGELIFKGHPGHLLNALNKLR